MYSWQFLLYHYYWLFASLDLNSVSRNGSLTHYFKRAYCKYGPLFPLINDSILCTGDLLLLKDGSAKPFYVIWNKNHNADKESIKKIAKLENIEILCTAHSKCSFDFRNAMKD